MAHNWTNEQVEAISRPCKSEKSVLISAAAGSGKTAVLVERVIRLITSEPLIRADKIVLVTFTKKAAFEMKERLEKALKSLPDSLLIRRQLIRLEDAQITTINAFCLNLIRENSAFAKLENCFVVEDENMSIELLAKSAMKATLTRFYSSNFDGVISKICGFFKVSSKHGDSLLQQSIWSVFKFIKVARCR